MEKSALKRGKKNGGKKKRNKHGVNQYTGPDPRQALFLTKFLDPQSPTFSNALQSALDAGYEPNYAKNITSTLPAWLVENIGESSMLHKAERNLNELLDLEALVPAMGAFGPILTKEVRYEEINGKRKKVVEKKPVLVINPKLLNIKKDASFFVAERIGKIKYAKQVGHLAPNVIVPVQVNVNDDREKYA